ncbi:MAG: hypothetical protein HZA78_12200 [Candidatus Schekmanbacteria bacterium]|nr:hypothetical protein [Candidatus Schekmanbacteria bacterium]
MKTMDKTLKLSKTDDSTLLQEIKKLLSLEFDDELFLFSGKDCLVLKKIQRPSLKERFNNLSKKVEKRFKKEGLTEDAIDEAIKWARK